MSNVYGATTNMIVTVKYNLMYTGFLKYMR